MLTTMTSMLFVGTISTSLWFFSTLIEGYRPARLAWRATLAAPLMVATLPLLHGVGHTHLMLKMANLSVLVGLAVLLVALVTAVPKRARQPVPLAILLAYLVVYSTLSSLPGLTYLDLIEPHRMVLFASLAHIVLDGVVMFVILQIRALALGKEKMQIALDLERSRQQTEDEKSHREEQSQLFAMLAHEMKTPLATLRMWMDMGQLKPEIMQRTIADMNQVIERCVHTGQLADQGLQPDWQSLEPTELTRVCIQSCRLPAQVDLLAAEVTGHLQTDAQMLSIVLGNLLDNACKYSAPGSRIQVSLSSVPENGQVGWLWQVINQAGPAGLPRADRLFEKYYRSAQARRQSGSGLGLFLVKGLLDLMQGRIGYEARTDRAVFSLWLPQETPPR
jgi:signal transduction histidine kinase